MSKPKKTIRKASPARRHAAPEPAGDLRPVEGARADRELAELARAVSSEVRVRMLRVMSRAADCCGADLRGEIKLAQPTISQHLQVLRDAGLVQGRADGRRV